MNIIVTGSAGFIGFSLCIKLLERGDNIIGIDNHNDYYDPKLKDKRLERLNDFGKKMEKLHEARGKLQKKKEKLPIGWSDESRESFVKFKIDGNIRGWT